MPKFRVEYNGWAEIEADTKEEAKEMFYNNECIENIENAKWEEVE